MKMSEINMRISALILTAAVLIYVLAGCKNTEEAKVWDENNLTLKDFVYNEDSETPYRVHLEEDSELTPYLVLSDDYGGNCLLLREYVLDDRMLYNHSGRYSGYYEDSEVDKFLSGEFFEMLAPGLRELIADTDVVITARESLGIGGTEVTSINRKIFLLAYTEVEDRRSRTHLMEGEYLPYFLTYDSRIAYSLLAGESRNWWLRTASTASENAPCVVTREGIPASSATLTIMGEVVSSVRPAFCISGDAKIVKASGEDSIYTLEVNEQD